MNLNILIPSAYLLIALVTARIAYGRIRAHDTALGNLDDVEDRILNGLGSTLIGVAWPVGLLIAVVMWKPAKTPAELKAERNAMADRIRELEAELGIRGSR